MSLGGGQEGEMVSTVGDGRVHDGQNVPEPGNGEVGAHDDRTQRYWEEVRDDLFERMTVDGGYPNRRCPLVVSLMDVFIDTRVVEYPMCVCVCVGGGGGGGGGREGGGGRRGQDGEGMWGGRRERYWGRERG